MFTFALYIRYSIKCEEIKFKSVTPFGWLYYRIKYRNALKDYKSHYTLLIGDKVVYRSR